MVLSVAPGPRKVKWLLALLQSKKEENQENLGYSVCLKDMAIDEVKEGGLSSFCHCFLLPLLFVGLFSVGEQFFQGLCTARTDRAQGDTSPT